jgi:protein gp37
MAGQSHDSKMPPPPGEGRRGGSSAISWTDYALTTWFGCSKVSDACDDCYAEAWTLRYRKAGWGPHAERVPPALSAWLKPYAWQRRFERGDPRRFVFASVNSDVFDNKAPVDLRGRVWLTIRNTPSLVWLILTKRPQNFRRMLPPDWGEGYPNVWLGVTAENRRETDRRLPILCRTPAARGPSPG